MQALPPYVSWISFLPTLDGFAGLASERLDSASIPGLSVSSATRMMQAFRFLGLAKPEGDTTPELKMLGEHPESRATILLRVFRQSYPELFAPGKSRLSFTVDVDVLRLDKAESELIFDLVDRIREYRQARQHQKDRAAEPNASREVIRRGDEEVPF